MKSNLFVIFLFVFAIIIGACGGGGEIAPTPVVRTPSPEPEWSYKIQAQPSDTAQIVTIWAKPELEVGNPILKWSDGFEVELVWGKESEPFPWHSIEEASLVVGGNEFKVTLQNAKLTQGGGFMVWIP